LDPLIGVRAVHFASTAMVAGAIFFQSFVMAPVVCSVRADAPATILRKHLAMLVWITLLMAVLSGLAWLLLLTSRISGQSVTEAFADGVVWTVLTETRFGHDWIGRFCIALLLTGILFFRSLKADGNSTWQDRVTPFLAACLLGSLAWSGHAGASPGINGGIHLTSDLVHLVAVGAWVGALPPFAMLLSSAAQAASQAWTNVAVVVAHRFSILGMLSVSTLIATGIINTLNLAGSVVALTATEYGELLLLKISLFIAMVGVAAVNRFRLLPRLQGKDTIRRLRRNTLIEIGLGVIIVFIVSALGTMPPGAHAQSTTPHIH
jgi:copper resistance protein D